MRPSAMRCCRRVEFTLWLKRNIQILLAPPEAPTKREYGGYAHGLAYLATSTSAWDKSNFMQFVFMQGSMVLSEPVPSIVGADADGCEVRALQNVKKVGRILLHGVWRQRTINYLSGVGLLPINATETAIREAGRLSACSANHNAVSATLKGLRQLLAPPGTRLAAGGLSVFDHPQPVVKMHSEFLTGLIINKLAVKHRRAATDAGRKLTSSINRPHIQTTTLQSRVSTSCTAQTSHGSSPQMSLSLR